MKKIGVLYESASDPAPEADAVVFYSKDIAGITKFFVRASDGSIVNLSDATGGLAIGSAVTSSTVGSLLFIDTGLVLAQDNANLFWNNAQNWLGLGTALPGTTLHVKTAIGTDAAVRVEHASVTGFAAIDFYDSAAVWKAGVGYANASVGLTQIASKNYFYSTGPDWVFANATRAEVTFGMTTGSTFEEMQNGGSAAVSNANTGRLRYNTTGQKFQVSLNGAAYVDLATGSGVAIGGTVTSGTTGSVLFVGAGPVLAQDNTAFFWNATNKILRLTQSAADPADGTGIITLQNTLSTSISQITWQKHTGVFQAAFGHGNANPQGSLYLYFDSPTSHGLLINSGTGSHMQIFAGVATGAGFQLWSGNTVVVSDASTGRMRYNSSSQKFQFSLNGGAYVEVPVLATALTTSSILFANASGQIAQDNATFRWVDATNNLQVGASAVTQNYTSFPLTVSVSSTDIVSYMWNTNAAGYGAIGFLDNAFVFKMNLGYGNSGTAAPFTSRGFIQMAGGSDLVFVDATTGEKVFWGMAANAAVMQIANGSAAAVSAANTGRLRYNTTGQKAQWSFNGGAYFDVGTYAAALTTGSVPFANASNQLAQDNARFFWNDTNKVLQLTTNHATTGPLNITATVDTAPSAIAYFNHGGAFQGYMGWFNNLYGGYTYMREKFGVLALSGQPFVLGSQFVPAHEFVTQNTAISYQMAEGNLAPVSAAGYGRIRYVAAQKFQVSSNAGAYFDFATYAAALTAGSIPFANSSNQLAQDNANLFWDDTNNRLGIRTSAAPVAALDVQESTNTAIARFHQTGAFTGWIQVSNGSGTFEVGADGGASRLTSASWPIALSSGGSNRLVVQTDGGIEWSAANAAAVSAANSGRLRYNSTTQVFQASRNAGAYSDVLSVDHQGYVYTAQTGLYYVNDFAGGYAITTAFTAGGGNGFVASEAGHPGIQVQTVTAVADAATWTTASGQMLLLGSGEVIYRANVKRPIIEDGTDRWSYRIGLGANTLADINDGVYFETDLNTHGDANWRGATANGATRTKTTLGVAPAAGVWDILEFVVNAAGTSIGFYVNGTLLATTTTNIPTINTAVIATTIKTLGSAARNQHTDYVELRQRLTTPR